MSEERIRTEIDKAAGNNKIEGYDISLEEKDLILRIFEKYKGDYGDKAIDSLLYGLVTEVNDMKEGSSYEKHKK